MTLVQQLCAVAHIFHEARHLSVGRVSTLVFGDGTKLNSLMSEQADITTARFERAMVWFSDHWPEGAVWPETVPRPPRTESSEAAA